MFIRSRAPLRLGLAGGGTDLSPYCEQYGGAVLNATIDLYAYATLEPLTGNEVHFCAKDVGHDESNPADPDGLQLEGPTTLHRAVYRRIVKDFLDGRPYPCRLTTYCEAPPGSGLGSSSTLVVAMVKAFVEALSLPLGEYDIAHLAFSIERSDAGLQGGRQDQYAATFGGFNFIEFGADDRVVVNPLRVKNWILSELEASIVLFHTGVSRSSAAIIAEQTRNISDTSKPIDAMHQLRTDAFAMKEAVLKGDFKQFANVLNRSWEAKKRTAASISNDRINGIFEVAMAAGAVAGKISGAGGGGFITFVVNPMERLNVIRTLESQDQGHVLSCSFTKRGTEGWRIEP